MTRENYAKLDAFMRSCAGTGAHDPEHVYRVLSVAAEIARTEEQVDWDVLIASCLLHDIGRAEQRENPSVCHAAAGAQKAYRFLLEEGFGQTFAARVRDCIATHRYRSDAAPASIEAKILFDADKVDVSGTLGLARALLYNGEKGEPLYSLLPDGTVSDGTEDASPPSFFGEYHRKLEKLYTCFYTRRGEELAYSRKLAAGAFYRALLAEARASRSMGQELLKEKITP